MLPPSPLRCLTRERHGRDGQVTHGQQLLQWGSVAASLPSLSLPSPAVHPQPAPSASSRGPGDGVPGAAPTQPQSRVLAAERLGLRGRGAPRVVKALEEGCTVAHPVFGGLLIAGGTARRALCLRDSQQVALPARSSLPCSSLASSALSPSLSAMDRVKTAQNTARRSSHLTLRRITPSSRPRQGVNSALASYAALAGKGRKSGTQGIAGG